MKVALLLTGQLRTYDMVKDIQMNCLIKHYDMDIFMSIDLDNSLQTAHKNPKDKTDISAANAAIEFFKPNDYCIIDSPPIVKNKRIRQYYVVKKAYELLKNYKAKTNTVYDVIMRLRFDQILYPSNIDIRSKLERAIPGSITSACLFNEANIKMLKTLPADAEIMLHPVGNNELYVFGFGDYKHYKYVNDQFFYHNESLIDSMCNFTDNIPEFEELCDADKSIHGARIEYMFYLYLQKMKIKYVKTQISGEFVRAINI